MAFSGYINFKQKIIRVIVRIVLPLLTKALYEFDFFEGMYFAKTTKIYIAIIQKTNSVY